MQKVLTIQEQIKQLGLLYLALISGQFLMAILLFFFLEENVSQVSDGAAGGSLLPIIIAFFCLMSIGMSFFIYNQKKRDRPPIERYT